MFRTTFCAQAVQLEGDGQRGVFRLATGMRAAGFGWYANKMLSRYHDALKAAGEARAEAGAGAPGEGEVLTEDGSIAAGRAQKRANAYVAAVKKRANKDGLIAELVNLGAQPPAGGWAKVKVNAMMVGLANNLAKLLVDGDVRWGDLNPCRDRLHTTQAADLGGQVDEAIEAMAAINPLTPAQLAGVTSKQIDLMGSDCVQMLISWRVVAMHLDANVETVRVVAANEQITTRRGRAAIEKKRASAQQKLTDAANETDEAGQGLAAELEQLLLDADGELERLAEEEAEIAAAAGGSLEDLYKKMESAGPCGLTVSSQNYTRTWGLLSEFLLPLHRREKFTGEWLQQRVDAWVDAWEASGTEAHGLYVHYLRRHAAADTDMLEEKWGMSLGSFSAQRSEHCNKLCKLRLVNLFPMRYGAGGRNNRTAAEILMRERLVRLIHYPATIPRRSRRKCGACGKLGHRSDSKRFHP